MVSKARVACLLFTWCLFFSNHSFATAVMRLPPLITLPLHAQFSALSQTNITHAAAFSVCRAYTALASEYLSVTMVL